MSVTAIPKITWGASFANTLHPGRPLDNPVAWSEPLGGYEVLELPGGSRDAWDPGTEERLAFDVRWIPGTATTTPEGNTQTGWDGSTGWAAFLDWARGMSSFRFYPDKDEASYHTCQLVNPHRGGPQSEDDGTRRLHLVIADTGGNAFTGYTYTP